uniref:NADH dehydrogenase subunit 4L n=1 Tax=Puliciphora borinquenensis TaxID=92546 RepID=UPI001D125FD6|nr:NADH dehydrogenase subunit 4L [Puliciphora borinquenensis]QZL38259.1 NADH dehydrogenase subunit 4L [Puliciphora borinquenensis]
MMMYWVLFLLMSGIYSFLSFRKFLLSMLLSLEFIMLSLFVLILLFNTLNYSLYTMMFFLIFVVCEGVLGLSILVSMIRGYSSNMFQSMNILEC